MKREISLKEKLEYLKENLKGQDIDPSYREEVDKCLTIKSMADAFRAYLIEDGRLNIASKSKIAVLTTEEPATKKNPNSWTTFYLYDIKETEDDMVITFIIDMPEKVDLHTYVNLNDQILISYTFDRLSKGGIMLRITNIALDLTSYILEEAKESNEWIPQYRLREVGDVCV